MAGSWKSACLLQGVFALLLVLSGISSERQGLKTRNVQIRRLPPELFKGTELVLQPDSVEVPDVPTMLVQDMELQVKTCCNATRRAGLEVRIWTEAHHDFRVFLHTWNCMPYGGIENSNSSLKSVKLKLPRILAYRPGHHNNYAIAVNRVVIRAWLLDPVAWAELRQLGALRQSRDYEFAIASAIYNTSLPPPNLRPERKLRHCLSWWKELPTLVPYTPVCPWEPEVYMAVTFPVALSGSGHGVYRLLPEYKDPILKQIRQNNLEDPRFTFVIWMYITEFCPGNQRLCSIMQHLTWDDFYMTPIIFINPYGQIHCQVVTSGGDPLAFLSGGKAPLHAWFRLIAGYKDNKWELWLHKYPDKETWYYTDWLYNNQTIWHNDTKDTMVFGGSELTPSFKGYIGEATIYRRKFVMPDQLDFPKPDHPMFKLGVEKRKLWCDSVRSWTERKANMVRQAVRKRIKEKSCTAKFTEVLGLTKHVSQPQLHIPKRVVVPKSPIANSSVYKAKGLLRGSWLFSPSKIGEKLYKHSINILEDKGLTVINETLPLLEQASCFGFHDATFLLAVILGKGVGVKTDIQQATSLLLEGALGNHQLCQLAMGNKHIYGLDGIPIDHTHSYVYFKNVGDRARQDREDHKEEDVHVENIRLTDEWSIEDQTDIDGDLFLWYKYHAGQGDVWAQRNIGRMLFWGAQGVERDLEAAAEYYRLGAEAGDPEALYDYGIVLLKGQGVKQNYSEAVVYFEKALKVSNHSGSINALGWHALEITRNYTRALELFEIGNELNNMDAIHNIGHMYLYGSHPEEKGRERVKAIKYFIKSAKLGQLQSCLLVSMYNMRGHPEVPQSPTNAVLWARYVAEMTPSMGKVLSKGMKQYREQNWEASLMYYLLAAEAGVEVGNFNLAYLCDENPELSSLLERECIYYHYNLSTQRDNNLVDPYALVKMGDYYWEGINGTQDPIQAALFYAKGAFKHNPHAIFNLAFLVEEGIQVPGYIWRFLNFPEKAKVSNITLLTELYTWCQDSRQTEAYLPCALALWRVQIIDFWTNYHRFVKFVFVLGILGGAVAMLNSFWVYLRGQRIAVNSL